MGTHRALRGGGTVDDSAFVEPSAYINGTASVGARSYVGNGVYVDPGIVIGTDCIICDRVRVVANVPNGTTLLCDCCSGGGGGGGGSILNLDSIHTVGSRLDALDTTGMVKGTLAYVGNDTFAGQGSVHRYYSLVYGEALTADGIEVVNSPTFGVDGAQWLSLDTVNQEFLQKLFWSVDETNGNDENNGWGATQAAADLTPLKSMAELNRRLFGAIFSATVQFHQIGNIANFTRLSNIRNKTISVRHIWLGTKTNVFPGGGGTTPVTTFTAANPAGNVGPQLNLAAIPASWTASGLVGLMVESADELRAAHVMKDLGAKTARVTTPGNPTIATSNPGTAQVFTNGEQVRVVSLSTIPEWPFPDDVRATLANVNLSAASVNFVSMRSGPTSTAFFCKFTGVRMANAPGTLLSTSVVLFQGGAFLGGGVVSESFCGVLNGGLTLQGGVELSISHASLDTQNSQILITEGASLAGFGTDSILAVWDCAGNCVDVFDITAGKALRFNPAASIYGTGNAAAIVAILSSVGAMPAIANLFATTGAANPLLVAGGGYPYAALPIIDAFTQTTLALA